MSIKDILVHVDGDDGSALGLAISQARRFGARLTGLFARNETHAPSVVATLPSEALLAAAEAAKRAFDAATAGIETRWWQIERGGPEQLVAEAVFCCHYVDLVVVGQSQRRGGRVPADFVEKLILLSGRPVLVVPPGGASATVGRRVVIGWRSGKEAARALHDSLPLMAGAEQVVVASVGRTGGLTDTTPRVDVVEHLRAHGLPVSGERFHIEDLGVMDALLSRAYDLDCDLLVVGAHRGKALSFGGKIGAGTRHILAHAGLPVLFAS